MAYVNAHGTDGVIFDSPDGATSVVNPNAQYLHPEVVGSFNHVRQVAPAAVQHQMGESRWDACHHFYLLARSYVPERSSNVLAMIILFCFAA